MTGSQSAAFGENAATLGENAPALSDDQDMQLSLPEATMFIIGTSGVLWSLLYGALNALFG